ncbi:MAG: hypothetical protein ACM32E_13320 [Gemmatimonadota bacterium]
MNAQCTPACLCWHAAFAIEPVLIGVCALLLAGLRLAHRTT